MSCCVPRAGPPCSRGCELASWGGSGRGPNPGPTNHLLSPRGPLPEVGTNPAPAPTHRPQGRKGCSAWAPSLPRRAGSKGVASSQPRLPPPGSGSPRGPVQGGTDGKTVGAPLLCPWGLSLLTGPSGLPPAPSRARAPGVAGHCDASCPRSGPDLPSPLETPRTRPGWWRPTCPGGHMETSGNTADCHSRGSAGRHAEDSACDKWALPTVVKPSPGGRRQWVQQVPPRPHLNLISGQRNVTSSRSRG